MFIQKNVKLLIFSTFIFGTLFGYGNLPYKDLVLFILRGAVVTRWLFSFFKKIGYKEN